MRYTLHKHTRQATRTLASHYLSVPRASRPSSALSHPFPILHRLHTKHRPHAPRSRSSSTHTHTAMMHQSPPQARRGVVLLLLLLALVGLGSLHAFIAPAPSSSSSSSSTLTKHARGKVSAAVYPLSFPLQASVPLVLLCFLFISESLSSVEVDESSLSPRAHTHPPSLPPSPPSLLQPLFNGGSENQMMEDGQTVSSLMAEYNAVRREGGREGGRGRRGQRREKARGGSRRERQRGEGEKEEGTTCVDCWNSIVCPLFFFLSFLRLTTT